MSRGEMILERFKGNPILTPRQEHSKHRWESERVFNCAAIYDDGKVHLVYRAQGDDGISRLGYASSSDGYHIEERLEQPIFSPADIYERLGCEDPRITDLENTYVMCYTSFGEKRRWSSVKSKTRLGQIGLTSISRNDFLNHRWNWSKRIHPFLEVDSKNSFVFPRKFEDKYVMYHRISPHIWLASSNHLDDWSESRHKIIIKSQVAWEYTKMGAGAQPIDTKDGWLLVYHAVDELFTYRLGAALADTHNPEKIVKRLKTPIFEPREDYEQKIVFTCGAIKLDGKILVYYGGDDRVIGVASCEESQILSMLEKNG